MYNKNSIADFLTEIGKNTTRAVNLYFIGGCNLCLKNLKQATHDVDLILESHEDIIPVRNALRSLGFHIVKQLTDEPVYKEAFLIFADETGSRIDIFIKDICQALYLSERMKQRCQLFKDYGLLKVYLVSNEDVFLFKSLAGRSKDIEDCYSLFLSNLNWKSIIDECVLQHKEGAKWIFWLFEMVCRLEDSKSLDVSSKPRIFRICEDNWQHRPTDWMEGFSETAVRRHIPARHQKEIIESLKQFRKPKHT